MSKEADPKMHTAEHILNQTMIRLFGTERCFSAHIEKKKSKCDYKFDRALITDEAIKLENAVNEIIKNNLPVTEILLTRDEAGKKFNLDRIPEGETLEKVRIIKVGDYDAVPCSGQHVKSTNEVGQFRLISSDYADGVLRVRYKLST